jgi:acyl-ACP thioesterase
MIHKHPSQRKGHAMATKWNNEFFVRIGLVPAFWHYNNVQYGHSLEDYIQYMKSKQKTKKAREIARTKECGQEYYTPERIRKMQYAQRLATY